MDATVLHPATTVLESGSIDTRQRTETFLLFPFFRLALFLLFSLSSSRFSLVPSSRGHQVRMHATRMHAFWRSIPSVESARACMRVCASAWILLRGWEMDEEAAIVLGCVISMRYFFARMGEWIHRNSICSFF